MERQKEKARKKEKNIMRWQGGKEKEKEMKKKEIQRNERKKFRKK